MTGPTSTPLTIPHFSPLVTATSSFSDASLDSETSSATNASNSGRGQGIQSSRKQLNAAQSTVSAKGQFERTCRFSEDTGSWLPNSPDLVKLFATGIDDEHLASAEMLSLGANPGVVWPGHTYSMAHSVGRVFRIGTRETRGGRQACGRCMLRDVECFHQRGPYFMKAAQV